MSCMSYNGGTGSATSRLMSHRMEVRFMTTPKSIIPENFVGKRFGRLTVFSAGGRDKYGARIYVCKCDCGTELQVVRQSLKSGNTKSCGCLKQELARVISRTHGYASLKTKTYNAWLNMRSRCSNESGPGWKNYGGRGITYCSAWEDFANFLHDMGESPIGLSLDRIDNDGNYEKDNCRWATRLEQVHNRRKTSICPNGHIYTPENTGTWSNGVRFCKICRRVYNNRRNVQLKQKRLERYR